MDISNFKTEKENSKNYLEFFKQKTIISATNTFQAIIKASLEHPQLKQIILMKQIPRYDCDIKRMLSKLFNDTLDRLYENCQYNNKIVLGNHSLNCSGGVFQARYNDIMKKKFDGIHLYGPSGMKAYTNSVLRILNSAQLVHTMPPKYYDQFQHKKCPQARYQMRQTNYQARQQIKVQAEYKYKPRSVNYEYSVPTYNKFARLAVQNYQGNF